ncbi:AraC family transcriptional regulator [Lentzea sp. NBRC 105346]|uniref:AraC family transcriptional regulator n=1 Tax=Lentzea sp. NBRC 105346 TaxID=3032205 RepID=UPI0024A36BB2|nr:helix-turn-helix transcriptional regulator [Lentzea sp. NBRC 105346]GLZ33781.1 AraC family transcriptional regulator [Lentzea sp. NBRC 105346]
MRHEPDVRSYAVTHRGGRLVLPQAEGWDQLIYSAHGTVTVHTGLGSWVVPPHRAMWVPGGIRHRIDVAGRATLRILYFAAGLRDAGCQVLVVSRLLRELIMHTVAEAPLYLDVPRHRNLVAVLTDLLGDVAPEPALQLPTPAEPRARAMADLLREHLSDAPGIAALAVRTGASRRTLERLFQAETGMTIGEWRRRQRMLEALRLLSEGRPVAEVAGAVGYATPSAFSAAFRTELGVAPTQTVTAEAVAAPARPHG